MKMLATTTIEISASIDLPRTPSLRAVASLLAAAKVNLEDEAQANFRTNARLVTRCARSALSVQL